jgi:hypothetical protein
MVAKTSYNDPTIVRDPPGGKHHEPDNGGVKLPTNRPDHKGETKSKSVSEAKVAKAEK